MLFPLQVQLHGSVTEQLQVAQLTAPPLCCFCLRRLLPVSVLPSFYVAPHRACAVHFDVTNFAMQCWIFRRVRFVHQLLAIFVLFVRQAPASFVAGTLEVLFHGLFPAHGYSAHQAETVLSGPGRHGGPLVEMADLFLKDISFR
jgi:hypothetical protein